MYKLTLKEYKNVFNEHYTSLCSFSNKYLGDLDISKDIVQDVFIKIWEEEKEFNDSTKVKFYLYASVKNKSLDYLKSKKYNATQPLFLEDIQEIETDPFFVSDLVIYETSIIIEKAINTLPKKCAQIIKLSLKGFSNSEIAKEMNIAVTTVKAQKRIAYRRLKPILKELMLLIAFIFEIGNN